MMRLANSFRNVNKNTLLILLLCCSVSSARWFTGIQQQNLNPDEVVWVAMSEFYYYRQHHRWQLFQLSQPQTRFGYASTLNILLDQPQMGKYIIGFVLEKTHQNPWAKQDISFVYQLFADSKITGDLPPDQVRSQFGDELINSIKIIRIASSIIGWVAISFFSLIVYQYTKNSFAASLSFAFLCFQPLFLNYFRKSMMDSFVALGILISGYLVVKILIYWQQKSTPTLLTWWCIAGVTSAVTSSIKLNGFFLLLLPPWLTLFWFLFRKSKDQNWRSLLGQYLVFLLSFCLTFIYLEPETWHHPIQGISMLFQTRLTQQQRFFSAFGQTHFFFVPAIALVTFFRQFNVLIQLVVFALFATGVSKTIKLILQKDQKTVLLGATVLFTLIVNSYYAQVSFDRYLIPTVVAFTFLCILGVEYLVRKLKNYV